MIITKSSDKILLGMLVNYFAVGGAKEWNAGPDLPIAISYSSMVEHPSFGVVLVGGQSGSTLLRTIFHLSNSNSEWKEMTQKLMTPRRFHTSILVPESITSCNLGNFSWYLLCKCLRKAQPVILQKKTFDFDFKLCILMRRLKI